MRIQAIDHVTLYVGSLDAVAAYYEEVFGFSTRLLPGSGPRTLSCENDAVHFFVVEDPAVPAEFVRRQHVSFQVPSLGPVVALLRSRGEPHETGVHRGFETRNYRWCEWRDPAGIRVECVETLAGDDPDDAGSS